MRAGVCGMVLGSCGARTAPARGDETGSTVSRDAGGSDARDSGKGSLDGGDAEKDGGTAQDGGANDASAPIDCKRNRDCLAIWPTGAFCWEGECCAGRLDRFGCVCGDQRGGCPPPSRCCDDPFHPEILVGCSEGPCDE